MKIISSVMLTIVALVFYSVIPAAAVDQNGKPVAGKEVKQTPETEVTLPNLPGITTPDKTPNACVNCHVNRPELNMDGRLLSILAKWKDGTDPKIFEKAKAAAAWSGILIGRHPDVAKKIKIIPDDCLKCHARDSKLAPPFAKLLHAIHLVGGKDNRFLANVKGTCTNCHKLDQKTGALRIGSGEAK